VCRFVREYTLRSGLCFVNHRPYVVGLAFHWFGDHRLRAAACLGLDSGRSSLSRMVFEHRFVAITLLQSQDAHTKEMDQIIADSQRRDASESTGPGLIP
jgi:hypothetical protein